MSTAPALADDPPPQAQVTLTAAPPPPTYAGASAVVAATLSADGQPLVGEPVLVERLQGGAWVPVATVATDATGAVRTAVPTSRVPAENSVRLTYRDDGGALRAQATVTIPLRLRPSSVSVSGPGRVIDEQ